MTDILVEKDIHTATSTLPFVSSGTVGLKYVSHTHSELEIFKCDRGRVRVTLLDREIILKAGEIVVFMPGDIHNVDADEDAVTSCIKFFPSSTEDFNYMKNFRLKDVKVTPMRARESIIRDFDEIIMEDTRREPMYATSICGLVQRICLTLIREVDLISLTQDERTKHLKNSSVLKSIDEYIASRYSQEITLETLAKHVNMSKFYLCRVFSEITGMGFVEYLTRFRLIKSVELMSDVDLSLVDIALKSGFTDVKCYIRSFKRYYLETPGKYRKNLLK
ncbi:MAG: AraC family transcriptional regulator [Clostridia bacterium]|nr:AraC family transcriptional regulator [Clostridia bacterium]